MSDSTTSNIEKVIFQLLMHASEVHVEERIVVSRKPASIGSDGIFGGRLLLDGKKEIQGYTDRRFRGLLLTSAAAGTTLATVQ